MGTGRPNEAARFFTAAVAIRPRSDLALRGLREALRAASRPDQAVACLLITEQGFAMLPRQVISEIIRYNP
jgi:hypothetical protein